MKRCDSSITAPPPPPHIKAVISWKWKIKPLLLLKSPSKTPLSLSLFLPISLLASSSPSIFLCFLSHVCYQLQTDSEPWKHSNLESWRQSFSCLPSITDAVRINTHSTHILSIPPVAPAERLLTNVLSIDVRLCIHLFVLHQKQEQYTYSAAMVICMFMLPVDQPFISNLSIITQ